MFKEGWFTFGRKKEAAAVERLTPELEAEMRTLMSEHAGDSHAVWVEKWKSNPENLISGTGEPEAYKPRLKPVDPIVDAEWIREHGDLVTEREGKDGPEQVVNIVSLSFDELPPSHKIDSLASQELAWRSLYEAIQAKRPIDQAFKEEVAERIHSAWLDRNRGRVEREIAAALEKYQLTREEGMQTPSDSDSAEVKDLKRRFGQLRRYAGISEEEKSYDRMYLENALVEYRVTHPEANV